MTELRLPPQSLDAEKALLGSVMLKPDILYDIVDFIGPECFYAKKHSLLYNTMLEISGKSNPIDLLSVSSRLKERDELDTIGGASYLTELVNLVPSAANALHYAEIVRKKFMMRRLIDAANNINQIGYDESQELEEILDMAEKKIYEVTSLASSNTFVSLPNELAEAFERLEKLHKSGSELRGVSTGFTGIDSMLSGFQPSDLIILAARPSMGKTALALDIARQTATKHNNGVLIFSLEMSSQQLVDRMLASESRVDAWRLRTGKIRSEDDFGLLRDALGRLSDAPIYIDDQPGNNILKMRSVARRLKREKDLKLIVVDYLQLMLPSGRWKNSDSMVQQVTEISRSLKIMARELDVPVLALSQLSRAVEQRGGKPRLSDLRDSGSIEQDADVVMFIHRDDKINENSDKPNIAEILIEKHRNGPVGHVELYFDDKKASFLNIDKSDFDSFGAEAASGAIDDF
jgi:replicative DNA helicase